MKPRPTRRRLWLFRMLAVGIGLCIVHVLELGLRLFGVGEELDLVVPGETVGWYRLNPKFDQPFFGQGDLAGPEPRPFQLPKPERMRRIVVVGGSTVIGFPYASELAFPRHLQSLLQAQAGDSAVIEVLNAGITALNSTTECLVAEDVLATDPDVIVVYTGHNEFYGPGGTASFEGRLSPTQFHWLARCRRSRLFQALRTSSRPSPMPSDLLEKLPADLHVSFGSELFEQTRSRFQSHLNRMTQVAIQHRVPIVLVSPVSNERDQPPIEPLPDDVDPEVNRLMAQAEDELKWGTLERAAEFLTSASQLQPTNARVRFRMGQVLDEQGQAVAAAKEFREALDHDGCRFRAPSVWRDVVRQVAQEQAANGVYHVDLYAAMCAASPHGSPGREHFIEHVHFTPAGNELVARTIAKCIWSDVWKRDLEPVRGEELTSQTQRLWALPEDDLAAISLALMVYEKPPFRDGMDADKLRKGLAQRAVSRFQELPAFRRQSFEQLTTAHMANDLLGALLAAAREKQQADWTTNLLRARVARQPWNAAWKQELADWLRDHGTEAEDAQGEGTRSIEE